MRVRTLLVAALIAAGASRAAAAGAGARAEVVAGVGGTTAVEGEPGDGGASLSLSLLWPLEDHFRFGLMGFADDLGQRRGRLVAPGGFDLGPVAEVHRAAIGAAWRMEAHLPSVGAYDSFVAATWGAYRVTDDVRGATTQTLDAAGFGLGFGLARRVAGAHGAGITLRYQQLSRGAAQRYLSAAVEWRWHRRATE
ncbi:MAG: hypothetical protein AAB113_02325 [Candidatus Eisenbacteria bacterium]